MAKKLHDGFSLIELLVALAISTTVLTLAFFTYGKIYNDSAKLEKYLKDELFFQNQFVEIYRNFQSGVSNSPNTPPGLPITINPPLSEAQCLNTSSFYIDYSVNCNSNLYKVTYPNPGGEPHIAHIYRKFN